VLVLDGVLDLAASTLLKLSAKELLRPECNKGGELVHRKVVVCVCTAPRFFFGEDFV
jgi:hypothetical protein